MARYKQVDLSPRLLPVDLESQLVPGTFAHALHHLVDELDLSAFNAHYCNDEAGAPAHSPAMLLRAVLLGYSQGLVSSRAIERQAALHDDRGLRQPIPRCDCRCIRAGA
jgi:transposase